MTLGQYKERLAKLAGDAGSQVRSAAALIRDARSRLAPRDVESVRSRMDKRRRTLHRQASERALGPQGEVLSAELIEQVEVISLDDIRDDPGFHNCRLAAPEEGLDLLGGSMSREGLKVPIVVVEAPPPNEWYHLRAGFRRVAAARKLGWKKIPAIVLPHDTPADEGQWINIIENSSRNDLTSHELASAAKKMRDEHGVDAEEFAARAGYSVGHIRNLLRCLDQLPVEVKTEWQNRAPIPLDSYVQWAALKPVEATKEMLKFQGRNPRVTKGWSPPPEVRQKVRPRKLATAAGMDRLSRLRYAIEVARELTEPERALCLAIADFCAGSREDVPRVYSGGREVNPSRTRRRED